MRMCMCMCAFVFGHSIGSSVTNVTVTGSFNVITRLTTNTSDTDVYISYTIAVTDIISLNISNMTLRTLLEGLLSNMTSLMLSPRENSTFSNSFNLSIELSNTNFTTADIVIADIVNVTVVEIEEKYNISVTCDIHPESMADMCMVVAIGTDNNITKGNIDMFCFCYAQTYICMYILMYVCMCLCVSYNMGKRNFPDNMLQPERYRPKSMRMYVGKSQYLML